MVSGTGYLFSREVMLQGNGWPFHSLSEDTEFTVNSILQGHRIGYCGEAELFDEQPTSLVQSCRQRMRWVRGNLMVFLKEGGRQGLVTKQTIRAAGSLSSDCRLL